MSITSHLFVRRSVGILLGGPGLPERNSALVREVCVLCRLRATARSPEQQRAGSWPLRFCQEDRRHA